MSEEEELFDDIDWYLTIERVTREGGPPVYSTIMVSFAGSRLYGLDPLISPGLYFMCLKVYEVALEVARPALPNRLYRKAKKSLDASMKVWELSGMEPVARQILSTEKEQLEAQLREEILNFYAEKGFDGGKAAD